MASALPLLIASHHDHEDDPELAPLRLLLARFAGRSVSWQRPCLLIGVSRVEVAPPLGLFLTVVCLSNRSGVEVSRTSKIGVFCFVFWNLGPTCPPSWEPKTF